MYGRTQLGLIHPRWEGGGGGGEGGGEMFDKIFLQSDDFSK